ncbi:MAG: peptide ABC transporter substrate-binding protein, partial [Candidatus Dormiibacterota bacterium]
MTRLRSGSDAPWSRRDFLLRGVGGATLLAGGTGILAACGQAPASKTASSRPTRGGQLVEAFPYAADTLNPVLATARLTDTMVSSLCFDGLLTYGGDGSLRPALAKAVPQVSPDGLSYVLDLRPNARWTDGRPITADDVVFTYDLHYAPQYAQVLSAIRGPLTEYLASVTASSASRVIFRLTKRYAPFLSTYLVQGIVPKHVLGDMSAEQFNHASFNTQPTVTSGMFKPTSFVLNSSITYAANDGYWGGRAWLDRYLLNFVTQDSERVTQLKTGEAGFANIPLESVGGFQAQPSIQLISVEQPTITFCVCQLDPSKPAAQILGDRRVRQALAHAVDQSSLVKSVYYGKAVQIDTTVVPPTSWAHTSQVTPHFAYDLDKSKQLLDEAGWKVGEGGVRVKAGQPLALTLSLGVESDWQEDAQILQQAWAKVGAKVALKVMQTAQLSQTAVFSRDFDLLLTNWGWTTP